MAKQNAKPLQVLIGQVVQNLGVDGVLTECRLILFEAKAPQPTPDVHAACSSAASRGPMSRCVSTRRPLLTSTFELVVLKETRISPQPLDLAVNFSLAP